MTTGNPYEERYKRPGYYWGTKPSSLCGKLLDLVPQSEWVGRNVVDLGCGEGRNAVFLASHGFSVLGIDNAPSGLAKVLQMAAKQGVVVETMLADIRSVDLSFSFDILLSTGTVQYIPLIERTMRFEYFKTLTPIGGLHAISALVSKPFIQEAPDAQPGVILFRSGELLSYYWDWEVLFCEEAIFDCNSGGVLHRHCANRLVARKM